MKMRVNDLRNLIKEVVDMTTDDSPPMLFGSQEILIKTWNNAVDERAKRDKGSIIFWLDHYENLLVQGDQAKEAGKPNPYARAWEWRKFLLSELYRKEIYLPDEDYTNLDH